MLRRDLERQRRKEDAEAREKESVKEKENFIKRWVAAAGNPTKQAEILWEEFSQTPHSHPLPFRLMRF